MNRLRKILVSSAIAVFLISIFMLFATTSNAVTFPVFDHLDSDTQAEFIAAMVDRTEQALRDDGKPDLALKTEQLFAQGKPTDPLSMGLAELESNVARARVADLDRLKNDPKAKRLDVEDALFVTLKKNGIELSRNGLGSVLNAMASFHEMTHAEFRAQSPAEQQHIVRSFAEIAFPDYLFREALVKKKSTFFGLDDKGDHNLAEIMSTQFPHTGDQPGFVHVASAIENNSAKYANVPVFHTVVIYFLKELQKGNEADIQKEMEWSVRLPDGRHAFPDDDYTFWVDSENGAAYKLEPNLQHLAMLLYRCIQTSGITDGWRAQTVCLEQVAGVHSPAAPPAAGAPPAAAPSTPPATTTDDDDPIGNGGLITPPDKH